MNLIILKAIIGLFLLQNSPENHNYLLTNGFVASGYDVVSYFENQPKLGNDAYVAQFEQVKYKFATAENLKTFKANPKKYKPKYGGWCAYAIGINGSKVSIDPESYRIYNNELFLFYKTKRNDTLKDWLKNEESLYKQAEINWKKIK